MKRSSWDKLIDAFKAGVHFVHSYREQPFPTLEQLAAHLDTLPTDGMTVDRVYAHGKASIALRKPDGVCSYLDRTGTVYQHGRFFVADVGWARIVYYKP
jgi:hypothetical protein